MCSLFAQIGPFTHGWKHSTNNIAFTLPRGMSHRLKHSHYNFGHKKVITVALYKGVKQGINARKKEPKTSH